MQNAKTNAAYDLSLFEPKARRVVALEPNKKQQQAMQHHARVQSITRIVSIFAVVAFVLGAVALMIIARVRLTEMNDTISELNDEIAILQSEHIRLQSELSAQSSAESLEQYALAHGMQKTEAHQVVYFSMDEGERAEVPESANESWWGSLCHAVSDWFA